LHEILPENGAWQLKIRSNSQYFTNLVSGQIKDRPVESSERGVQTKKPPFVTPHFDAFWGRWVAFEEFPRFAKKEFSPTSDEGLTEAI